MKIQLASDLHLEFIQRDYPGKRLIEPAPGADVLVLAGDIANGTQAIELFADWPVQVLYVAGNHEFYGYTFDQLRIDLRKAAAGTSIHFLDNDAFQMDGVRFLGATLWTDYKLARDLSQLTQMRHAERCIRDHSAIRAGNGYFTDFTAQMALDEHEKSRAWLENELAKPFDGKTVVITHHGCHRLSVHPRYVGNVANAAFVSDLSSLLFKANFWLHGHVHDSFDYSASGCRVVANPRGYAKNRWKSKNPRDFDFENPLFDPALVIDTADPNPRKIVAPNRNDFSQQTPIDAAYWICNECARKHLGPARTLSHTFHLGECGVCGEQDSVTAVADFAPRPRKNPLDTEGA